MLDDIARVVDASKLVHPPLVLTESAAGNKCTPVPVSFRGRFWAIRLSSDDGMKMLAGSKADPSQSFRRLPDYLIFAEPRVPRGMRKTRYAPDLHVLVCELKSSQTGAASGIRQVQLGRFAVEYLVRLGSFAQGAIKSLPTIDIRGVIVSPPSVSRSRG